MKGITRKVITREVIIEGKRFVLISDIHPINKSTYYGTISYDDIDENGILKRRLDGFDMCIGESIDEAISNREDEIKFKVNHYR